MRSALALNPPSPLDTQQNLFWGFHFLPWDGIPPTLIRTCPYVDPTLSPWALFEEMHWQQQQMAIVLDGKGNPLGMVTLEDLLEILVGNIEDEFDHSRTAPRRRG